MVLNRHHGLDVLFAIGVAFAVVVFVFADVRGLLRVFVEKHLAGLVRAVFVDGEVGVDFILAA